MTGASSTNCGRLGWRVAVLDLGAGFPFASAATRAEAARVLTALPADQLIVIDGLAFGVLAEAAQTMRATHRLVALVHHPLALESGLSVAQADALRDSERAALACAAAHRDGKRSQPQAARARL